MRSVNISFFVLAVLAWCICSCSNTTSSEEITVGVENIPGFTPDGEGSDRPLSSSQRLSSSDDKSSSSLNKGTASSSSAKSTKSEIDWSLSKSDYLNPDIEYGELTDERDGKKYKTVQIGEQTWMAENLNYADSNLTPSLKGRNWCIDNDEETCEIFGRFYTWTAAIDSVALANDKDNPRTCGHGASCELSDETIRGICPEGWHVPSSNEWTALNTTVGGEGASGELLKSKKGWLGDYTGTDEYGFSAIPAGFPRPERNAVNWDIGERTFFACVCGGASEDYIRNEAFVKENNEAYLASNTKWNAVSVRCLKD